MGAQLPLSTAPRRGNALLRYAAPVLLFYAVLEIGFSALCTYGVLFPQRSVRIFEESQNTILFDPVLGTRVTETPARAARIIDGAVDHVERFVGNAQGFSDRNDFNPDRTPDQELRIAVLGDSFSAMKALDVLWPERVEDLASADGRTIRLMNFSIGGSGLANWWSVLERYIVPNEFEIDALVFPVFDQERTGDLHRRFLMSDHAHGGVRVGLTPSWDPAAWPTSWEEAAPIVTRRSRFILTHDQFERAIAGQFDPGRYRPWRPYLARTLLGYPLNENEDPYAGGETTSNDHLSDGPLALTLEMAKTCRKNGWPVYVVRVPSREDAMNRTPPSGVLRDFASKLDATLVDGVDAFRDIDPAEIPALWLPRDGHWNQQGSDKFAALMWNKIQEWYPPKTDPGATPPPQTTSK